MEIKTIYRIEKPETKTGMWYNNNAKLEGIITKLCPNGLAATLPMDYSSLHRKDNKKWYSSVDSIKDINYFFSKEDVIKLCTNGFGMYEIKVSEFQKLEHETLFTREGVISIQELILQDIYK